MHYERSLAIEKRLQDVLQLVKAGHYSTPAIAKKLGVSVPTISRDVSALRERGHDIRAERQDGTWRFVLSASETDRKAGSNSHQVRRAATA